MPAPYREGDLPWTGAHAAAVPAEGPWTGAHAAAAPAAQGEQAANPSPVPAGPATPEWELPGMPVMPEPPEISRAGIVAPDPRPAHAPVPAEPATRPGKKRRLLIAAIAGTVVIGAASYGAVSGFTGPGPSGSAAGSSSRGPESPSAQAPGTAAPASVPSPDPDAAKKIAYAMLPGFGFNQTTQYSCLLALWDKLSGWDAYAGNESGGYGIPQATPGDIMASAGANWRTDAATQVKWGLGYIKETYGTPCGAWQYLQSHGSY